MADELGGWYVRARGRILGPFTWAQLESLRDRGQLARFHEVSKDRQAWMGAAGLAQLFAPSDAGAVSLGSAASSAESTDSNGYGLVGDPGSQPRGGTGEDLAVWFYAREGTHQGPLPIGELRRMAGSGEIDPYTLVWTKGMPNWIPANQVPELGLGATAGLSSSGPAGPSLDSGRQAPLQPSVYQPSRTSGLAVASLVLGILWLCGLGSLLATIFGAVALSQISRSRGQLEGKGLAIAGLVLGIIGMSLFALPFFTSYLAAILHSTAANRL